MKKLWTNTVPGKDSKADSIFHYYQVKMMFLCIEYTGEFLNHLFLVLIIVFLNIIFIIIEALTVMQKITSPDLPMRF